MRPYTDDAHEVLRERARRVARAHQAEADPRRWVALLGDGDLLRLPPEHDLRSLCVVREEVAWASPLGDAMVALQGLGGYLPARFGGGRRPGIAAFALTEPDAGSDLSAIGTRAARAGTTWRVTGHKWLISNAGLADYYVVLARTGEGPRDLSAFLVEAGAEGLATEPQEVMDPHPIGEVRLAGTPATPIGAVGEGLSMALATLGLFRVSVGAAACGLARRALDEAVAHARAHRQFGGPLGDLPIVQAMLADAATELAAARGLVYRAAWMLDAGEEARAPSSMAKLFATEAAQRVVDAAVQVHGGRGVLRGSPVERLYRAVRSLRIYEGASEVHKLIVAREVLRG